MVRLFFLLTVFICVCVGHEESPFIAIRKQVENNSNKLQNPVQISTWKFVSQDRNRIGFRLDGVENPSKEDLVLLYSPASADPSSQSPVDFLKGDELGEEYIKSGSVSSSFKTFKTGSDFAIRFFKHVEAEGKFYHGAVSEAISIDSLAEGNAPSQIHIAMGDTKTEINVMWTTLKKTNEVQILRFGTEKGKYSQSVQANSDTYTIKEMCGAPANQKFNWVDPGTLWNATVTGIPANTRIFYVVGSKETGFSKEKSFLTPPKQMSDDKLTFLAIGDLGVARDSHPSPRNTLNAMKNESVNDLVIHVGDISYARGHAADWPKFMAEIEPVASKVPWMTLPGNHERDWPGTGTIGEKDSGGECGIPYERRFKMPQSNHARQWYSFEYGPVHFSFISTELPFKEKSPQHRWLIQDFASVNRTVTPWLVIAGHRPMYVSTGGPVAKDLRNSLEPLLKKFKVDVAFWGHVHAYERTCPVHDSKCVEGATTHVVVGNAGATLSKHVNPPLPHIFKHSDAKRWGHSRVTVNRSHFKLEYIANQDGEKVSDSFVLKK